jgi:hypothetical protein
MLILEILTDWETVYWIINIYFPMLKAVKSPDGSCFKGKYKNLMFLVWTE